jgi:hypothetical protein
MLTMRGAETFREQGSNSSYGQRKVGVISTSSIGRFRQVLSPPQIIFIQQAAKAHMQMLDYQFESFNLTPAQQLRFAIADRPLNWAYVYAWRIRDTVMNQRGRALPDYRIVAEATTS